jgi:hypothetical protein
MIDAPHIIGESAAPAPYPERPEPPPPDAPQWLHDNYAEVLRSYEKVCAAWHAIWGPRH